MKQHVDLKVVIAYENLTAALRAKELVDDLAGQLAPGMEIDSDVWKFDCLGHATLRKAAFTEASRADMIIIASGAAELPSQVEDWIESCLCERGDAPTALVALPDLERDASGETSPLCAALRQMAERRHASYFCPKTDRERRDVLCDFERFQPQPARIPVTWEEVPYPEPAYREWGIND